MDGAVTDSWSGMCFVATAPMCYDYHERQVEKGLPWSCVPIGHCNGRGQEHMTYGVLMIPMSTSRLMAGEGVA